jgi:hypothetical protein
MSAEKINAIYDEAPAKVIATALKIISLKCFAVDPRYNNPRHSLIQGLVFASSFYNSHHIDPCDVQESVFVESLEGNTRIHQESKTSRHVLHNHDHNPDEFETTYGCTVEQILNLLNEQERKTFYEMADRRKKGKVSNNAKVERAALIAKLQAIKPQLHNIAL